MENKQYQFNNDTIIITDPSYIIKYQDWTSEPISECPSYLWESTIFGDWSCFTYKGTQKDCKELAIRWDNAYTSNWNDVQLATSDEERKELIKEFYEFKKEWVQNYCYGQFCADAGLVAVFKLEDVEKYNSNIVKELKQRPWLATIIPDFTGDIEYVIGDNEDAHIIGTGPKINFWTTQSGL